MTGTLLAVAMALVGWGCGAAGPELRAWHIEPPYIPPPQPSDRTVAPPATTQRSGPPSDAEVTRDLQQVLGADKDTSAEQLIDAAGLTPSGLATVPPSAPRAVAEIIRAANQVARKPYVYGGGHGRLAGETWIDSAYDCSGSVSFALANAGFLQAPLASGGLATFGASGPGRWVTIYANAGHAFMTVAGLRFDTSGRAEGGSRWQTATRSVAGFTVRHPPGL